MRILNIHLELYQGGLELWETFQRAVTQAMEFCHNLNHPNKPLGGYVAEFEEIMLAIRETGNWSIVSRPAGSLIV
ncbi:MAG: hypothetical protein JW816_01425 [Candidatus Buchananbacteria bacterium]|nr:hypothetical protein [Candidatus Buchananbacteria bacterium]